MSLCSIKAFLGSTWAKWTTHDHFGEIHLQEDTEIFWQFSGESCLILGSNAFFFFSTHQNCYYRAITSYFRRILENVPENRFNCWSRESIGHYFWLLLRFLFWNKIQGNPEENNLQSVCVCFPAVQSCYFWEMILKKKTKAEGNQANSFSKSHICFGLGVFDNREYLTGKSFDRQPFVLITGCFVYKFDWIVTRRGSNPRSCAFTFWLVSVVQVVEIFLNSWKKVSKKDHC